MKSILKTGWVLFLYSCGRNSSENSSIVADSTLKNIYINSAKIESKNEITVSANQQKLNKNLADTAIDPYYKEIYRQGKLTTIDYKNLLSLPKKLFKKDTANDLFFFIVFTKSLSSSDEFYSEGAGLTALKFVTENTEKFAVNFNNAPYLNDQDLNNWAKCIYSEIQISNEKFETRAVRNLENRLLKNIKGSKKENIDIVTKLIEKINQLLPN
ncbi:MAG: hypothetical protein H7321_02075 [Bacteroidia bacterium]|nr:hypothetical protein [Bacteroidia bacterium]